MAGTIDFLSNPTGGGYLYPITLINAIYDLEGNLLSDTLASMNSAISAKASSTHNHDTIYAKLSHTHIISDITNLQSTLDSKAASNHTHAISDITNLQSTLDGKASYNHTHAYLPLSGGIMTGSFDFANNTWNAVGDDVLIGDQNGAGRLFIKGNNGTTGISFVQYDGSNVQTLTSDGTTMNIEKNLTVGGIPVAKWETKTSGGVNSLQNLFTTYNAASDGSGLHINDYGFYITVRNIGTPFQIYIPDSKFMIAKRRLSSSTFNNLYFVAKQSGSPNEQNSIWAY